MPAIVNAKKNPVDIPRQGIVIVGWNIISSCMDDPRYVTIKRDV